MIDTWSCPIMVYNWYWSPKQICFWSTFQFSKIPFSSLPWAQSLVGRSSSDPCERLRSCHPSWPTVDPCCFHSLDMRLVGEADLGCGGFASLSRSHLHYHMIWIKDLNIIRSIILNAQKLILRSWDTYRVFGNEGYTESGSNLIIFLPKVLQKAF